LGGKDYANKTVNRILSSTSSFWKWMAKRGWLTSEVNPWAGQGDHSKKRDRSAEEGKRPYTAEELKALLKADPKEHKAGDHAEAIRDLVRLGLVTGCRLNELCELQVRDVLLEDKAIRIREGKTANATRVIPVHASVWPIIERRKAAAGGKPQARLFGELKPGGPDGKHSWYVSKVFTRFRRSVLGESDAVDFHSLRRTFATYLEHASTRTVKVNPQVIAELMGHEKGTLALSVYSGGLRLQHLRDAIEAMGEVIEPEVRELLSPSSNTA
jgi:integrase